MTKSGLTLSHECKQLLGVYFKLYPHPVVEEEFEKYKDQFSKLGIGCISSLRGIRTKLLRQRVLDPTPEELDKEKAFFKKRKKNSPGSSLQSLILTKKATKRYLDRNCGRPIL